MGSRVGRIAFAGWLAVSGVMCNDAGGPDGGPSDGTVGDTFVAGDAGADVLDAQSVTDGQVLVYLGFDEAGLGPYTCATLNPISLGGSIVPPPFPWSAGECEGAGNAVIVYNAENDAGWPAPAEPPNAAAFNTVLDPDAGIPKAVRIQLHYDQLQKDRDYYIGYLVYVPPTTPAPANMTQGLTLNREYYGPPFEAGPSNDFSINTKLNGTVADGWYFRLADESGWPWLELPVQEGTWQSFVEHVVLDTSPSLGVLEVWFNGVKQPFVDLPRYQNLDLDGQSLANDATTAHIATMASADTVPNYFYLNNYRAGTGTPHPVPVVLFFDGVKIATSFEAAYTPPPY